MEPPWGVEPQTYALREIRSSPPRRAPVSSVHVKGAHRAQRGHVPNALISCRQRAKPGWTARPPSAPAAVETVTCGGPNVLKPVRSRCPGRYGARPRRPGRQPQARRAAGSPRHCRYGAWLRRVGRQPQLVEPLDLLGIAATEPGRGGPGRPADPVLVPEAGRAATAARPRRPGSIAPARRACRSRTPTRRYGARPRRPGRRSAKVRFPVATIRPLRSPAAEAGKTSRRCVGRWRSRRYGAPAAEAGKTGWLRGLFGVA